VTLKSTVSTVVVTTLVLEGWSRELDPDLHIMDALRDMLAIDWKQRLSTAVDKVGAICLCLGVSDKGDPGRVPWAEEQGCEGRGARCRNEEVVYVLMLLI
jgi:hypothetical protein